jgi:hypothetical protein
MRTDELEEYEDLMESIGIHPAEKLSRDLERRERVK